MPRMDHSASPLPPRPRGLIVLTSLLALFQVGAIVAVAQTPADIVGKINLPSVLTLILAAGWIVAFVGITARLWQRKPGAKNRAVWLAVGFIVYSLARLALFAHADYDRQRLPFLLMATFFVLIMVLAGTFLVRSAHQKPTETVKHGSESEN